ncbi:MAG: acyl-CoA dehydrogenase family protein, partial [Acidimicrobiales bacterium]
MTSLALDIDVATDLIERAESVIRVALKELIALGGVDANQSFAYDLAHAASALATARSCLVYAQRGDDEARLVAAFLALAFSDLATRVLGREATWNVEADWFTPFQLFVAAYLDPSFLSGLAETPGPRHLGEEFSMVGDTFHRFAEEQVRPHAEEIHRTNGDIPEAIITGLSELGGFGLSIPEKFGGFSNGGESEYLG